MTSSPKGSDLINHVYPRKLPKKIPQIQDLGSIVIGRQVKMLGEASPGGSRDIRHLPSSVPCPVPLTSAFKLNQQSSKWTCPEFCELLYQMMEPEVGAVNLRFIVN